MYCSTCAAPLAPGLSYCNRCGASLKEPSEPRQHTSTGSLTAFLIAIVLVGIVGLSIILGGVLALSEAHLAEPIVGFFMFFSFIIVAITELFLGRQLSRMIGGKERKVIAAPARPSMPGEFQPAQLRTPAEPISSVTENTTRTLDFSRNDPSR